MGAVDKVVSADKRSILQYSTILKEILVVKFSIV